MTKILLTLPCIYIIVQFNGMTNHLSAIKSLRKKEVMKMKEKVTYDVYKDCPIICLPIEGTTKRMAFGVRRAQAILRYLPEIRAFVKQHEKENSKK